MEGCCYCPESTAMAAAWQVLKSEAGPTARSTEKETTASGIARGREVCSDSAGAQTQKLTPTSMWEISASGLTISETVSGSEKLSDILTSREAVRPRLITPKSLAP